MCICALPLPRHCLLLSLGLLASVNSFTIYCCACVPRGLTTYVATGSEGAALPAGGARVPLLDRLVHRGVGVLLGAVLPLAHPAGHYLLCSTRVRFLHGAHLKFLGLHFISYWFSGPQYLEQDLLSRMLGNKRCAKLSMLHNATPCHNSMLSMSM